VISKLITGGQTGADQAALRAARAAGIPTGGWAPLGWETEDGPAPWLEGFGLVECDEPGYPARTEANVTAADATLWFGDPHSPGGKLTLGTCRELGKPFLIVGKGTRPSEVSAWLRAGGSGILNVAGNRESKAPGIGARVERFLCDVFRRV
jgi:hypothetical protein